MDKYNINISYGCEDLNVLFVKVLTNEIKKINNNKSLDGVTTWNYFNSLGSVKK